MVEKNHPVVFQCYIIKQFFWPGVLNKDLTVWVDGRRPANACIPTFLLEKALAKLHSAPTLKNTFASIKN